ncbi:P22 [Hamiltonella phage APSE-1]|uniref:Putative protein p22 n=1 Tax=Acyrthosiphon pisum secondary endosymbiont phage 1 TaxID=2682836 RepID=VP22_BPAPS|nr:hypothetical protein APSE-1_22 [Hamiltonella phage APSE-1]Q9T1S6.1 RecName: Full=Putative protein p22 [Hamiltonella phage APSE-1]AAF03965.1 P22 [Hamiltonella phage APSE-1]
MLTGYSLRFLKEALTIHHGDINPPALNGSPCRLNEPDVCQLILDEFKLITVIGDGFTCQWVLKTHHIHRLFFYFVVFCDINHINIVPIIIP